ncbi:MAG: hypothetical protein LBV67_08265 [Streptococcaceae bacterium]|jgi:hypothetical protein|nr:hypothetical protein [Streptococcaceae bacterium]
MTDKKEILAITEKYGSDYARFSKEATRKEFKTVLKWVADEANRKQRELVGLKSE